MSRRHPGASDRWRRVQTAAVVVLAVTAAAVGFEVGIPAVDVESLRAVVVAGTVSIGWSVYRQASNYTERVEPTLLLPAVSAATVSLGVAAATARSAVVSFLLPVAAYLGGVAVGAGSPTTALFGVTAVLSFGALLTAAGVTLAFASHRLAGTRVGQYDGLVFVVLFLVGFTLWLAVVRGPVETAALTGLLSAVPVGWLVDLATLPTRPDAQPRLAAFGLAVTVGTACLLSVVSVRLGARVWTTATESTTTGHESKTVTDGRVPLPAGPAATVARKRWLQERRVPQGLYTASYTVFGVPAVILPAISARSVPAVSVLPFQTLCAGGAGLAFGTTVFAAEYDTLSATLTAVEPSAFVRGTVLAAVVPSTAAVVASVPVGLLGGVGVTDAVGLLVSGIAVCLFAAVAATAVGVGVSYDDFRSVPIPLVGVVAYTEVGLGGFLSMAWVVALAGVVVAPATVVVSLAFLGDPRVTLVVRVAGYAATVLLAAVGARVGYRRAVTRISNYRLANDG